MRHEYSARLRDDVNSAVCTAFKAAGIVNITATAEQVRVRNLAENVALEDIEHLVLQAAQLFGAAIEFDSSSNGLALLANDLINSEEPAVALPDLSHVATLQ